MKKIILTAVLLISIMCVSSGAKATTLTFDYPTTDYAENIYNGYGGFQWSGYGAPMAWNKTFRNYTGLLNMVGVSSGNYAAVGAYSPGASFIITSSTLNEIFTFNSAWFGSPYLAGNTISIKGYLNNVLQNQDSVDIIDFNPTFYDAANKFVGIDKIVIGSSLNLINDYIAMDDFRYNEVSQETPTPEPSLMFLGFMGVSSLIRFRKKAIV